MSQSTYKASAYAVGIRHHTTLLAVNVSGTHNINVQRLHDGPRLGVNVKLSQRSRARLALTGRSGGMRDYCTHHSLRTLKVPSGRQHRNHHPHLITALPKPQAAMDSTPLVAKLTQGNRCKMVALHTLNCRKPTVANAKFNLHSISTM